MFFSLKYSIQEKISILFLSETSFHLKTFYWPKGPKNYKKKPYAQFTKLMICRLKLRKKI